MPRPAPLAVDTLIGRRLRRLRVRAGLHQHDLAPLGHVGPSTLDRYESGENAVPAGRLQLFAAALGVDVACFYFDTPLPRLTLPGSTAAHAVRDGALSRPPAPAPAHRAAADGSATGSSSPVAAADVSPAATAARPKQVSPAATAARPDHVSPPHGSRT